MSFGQKPRLGPEPDGMTHLLTQETRGTHKMVFTIASYNTESAARGSILSIMEEKARNPQCAEDGSSGGAASAAGAALVTGLGPLVEQAFQTEKEESKGVRWALPDIVPQKLQKRSSVPRLRVSA